MIGSLTIGLTFGGVLVFRALFWPPSPDEYPLFLWGFVLPVGLATLFPVVFIYNVNRTIRRLRPIAPLIADADLSSGPRGVTIVFHDGLVLGVPGPFVVFLMFFAANGQVLYPSLVEAVRWWRLWGTRRVGFVRGRKGPPPVVAELDALRLRMGGPLAACQVRQRTSDWRDANAPSWIAGVSFASHFARVRLDQMVPELPAIRGFLRHALFAFAGVGG
ncbi:MAG: hypothetical protein E6K18_03225 [Methanobacteriota archaeon]|nr:MAG: hypothetical protein E6K18_03225 [Euryarchaeota archaeon]